MGTEETPKPYINVDFFEDLTGEIKPQAAGGGLVDVGRRIRHLREERGLSLETLSQMTGFEVDLLDQIETGQAQPQLGTLMRLSKALEGAFGRLVSGVGERIYAITRKADRKVIGRSTTRKGAQAAYTYMSLVPEVKGRHMEALVVQLESDPDQSESVHEGEEFIFVLEGDVMLKIGEERFDLTPGDSAYYLSTTPHLITAAHDRAMILAVIYQG
jgi:transcriptional regulator with XRE-family HTH domain